MPELPEVETTLRGIQPYLNDRTIVSAVVRNPKLRIPINSDLVAKIQNQKIVNLSRRAKYLILHLNEGFLVIHLGMSGHLKICSHDHPLKKHDHVDLILDSNHCLRFNDPRRFGIFLYFEDNPIGHPLLNHLGPEPLSDEFNPNYLFLKIQKRNLPAKSLIMNNQIVVGVGNIYATESLFLSKIHPSTPAKNLSINQCTLLVQNIKQILTNAIEMGGTTLRDFFGADGKPGYFNLSLAVYGRQSQPCMVCKTKIEALTIGGRTSTYCPTCQAH